MLGLPAGGVVAAEVVDLAGRALSPSSRLARVAAEESQRETPAVAADSSRNEQDYLVAGEIEGVAGPRA